MRSRVLVVVGMLGALVVVLATTGRPDGAMPAQRPTGGFAVTGYAGDWTSTATLDEQAPALTTVGIDGVDLDLAGDAVASPSPSARALLAAAHADGLRVDLLVGNDAVPNSSTAVAGRLLLNPHHRARVVAQLVRLVRHQRWDGITVDIEALAPRDADGLVAFLTALRSRLPAHSDLSVDVTATTSAAEYPELGYHLAALGRVATVVLMAYDEDGPWSLPGPIGGLPWQREAIAAVLRAVPRARLVLGVAAYGYSWPSGGGVHDGDSVTVGQARRLAAASGKHPRWISSQGEWTVRLGDGTVLWWSDSRSYRERLRLAERDHLGGLAVWQLSSADRLPVG
jgi:spore germination protein